MIMIWLSILLPLWADPADGPSNDGFPNEECAEKAATSALEEKTGESIYQATCQSCHQANGSGTAGVYPPLTNSEFVKGDPKILAHIILRGLSGEIYVNEERYASYMSAYGKKLSDKEMQQLIYYVQSEFGYPDEKDKVSLMDEKEIATIRANNKGRIKGMKALNAITAEPKE